MQSPSLRAAVIDLNILVALLNPLDHRRKEAVALQQALENTKIEVYYFDCIIAEALSTTLRRLEEKQDSMGIQSLFAIFSTLITKEQITWVLPYVPDRYTEILALMQSTGGTLNFHDALIALACRDLSISGIVSLDTDFDQIRWLKRISTPSDLVAG